MSKQPRLPLPVGTILNDGSDDYEIVDPKIGKGFLGSGGFGITYLAIERKLSRKVAIKEYYPDEFAGRDATRSVVPTAADQAGLFAWGKERFLEEARMLAGFDHPNLLRVLGYFEANNTAYMVLPYIEGKTLDQRYKDKLLTEEEARELMLQLIDGLKQVHGKGMLHRDIKPANIILTGAKETPVLIDFGSGRSALGQKSNSLTAIVSAPYSPKEQYSTALKQTPATDIYSLGATIYRAMLGEGPPDAITRDKEALSELENALSKGAVSSGIYDTLQQSLKPDESDRFRSLIELEAALRGKDYVLPNGDRTTKRRSGFVVFLGASLAAILCWVVFGYAYPEKRQDYSQNVLAIGSQLLEQGRATVSGWFSNEDDAWQAAQTANTIDALQAYIDAYPSGQYVADAKDRITKIVAAQQEEDAWRQAQTANTVRSYDRFIDAYPNSRFAKAAKDARERLIQEDDAWQAAQTANTIDALRAYIDAYPSGQYVADAKDRITKIVAAQQEEDAWQKAKASDTRNAYQKYIRLYPSGRYFTEAAHILAQSRFDSNYRDKTVEIQKLLAQEECLKTGEVDGYFGSASKLALQQLTKAKDRKNVCRSITIPTTVGSRESVPPGWVTSAKKIESEIKECIATAERPVCNPKDYAVYVSSNCKYPFKIFVVLKSPSGEWRYHGWYSRGPYERGDDKPLGDGNGNLLITKSSTLYYYAETNDGKLKWEGSLRRKFGGREFGLRKLKANNSRKPNFLTLPC